MHMRGSANPGNSLTNELFSLTVPFCGGVHLAGLSTNGDPAATALHPPTEDGLEASKWPTSGGTRQVRLIRRGAHRLMLWQLSHRVLPKYGPDAALMVTGTFPGMAYERNRQSIDPGQNCSSAVLTRGTIARKLDNTAP